MGSPTQDEAASVRELPGRIDSLLDRLAQSSDPMIREVGEDLVGAVLALYGEGLTRAVSLLADLPDGDKAIRLLADDELVGNLLLLHDLHPDSVETRIQNALDAVRPYLGLHEGGIEFQGIDEHGIAHLALKGNCDSCPSSNITIQTSVEQAVLEVAPEILGIEVEGMVEPAPKHGGLLQIQTRKPDAPTFDSCPVPEAVGQ